MCSTLADYESQLQSVNEALKHANGSQRVDLLDLKSKLEEVVLLLGHSSNHDETTKEEINDSSLNEQSKIDDEFTKFQMEMALLDGASIERESKTELNETPENGQRTDFDELIEAVTSLEGSKCRAPFSQPWGEKEYHNALIVSTNFDPDTMETVEDIEIEVMFCHPICDQMKPCSFFLSGHCKFSDDKCRFSHGHRIKFSELQEFTLPNYSAISVDSKCLAQSKDGLWYRATVEKCLKERNYIVKYDRTGKSVTLEAEAMIPLEEQENYCKSQKDDNYDLDDNDVLTDCSFSTYQPFEDLSSSLPSAMWEQHSRGIGSKLMEKMGHIWGQGLGKNSDGRLDPVEAFILPAGKSLDKCIEMRDSCHLKGPVTVESRLASEQDREEHRAKKIKVDAQPPKKETVFDFINSRIAKAKGEGIEIQKKGYHDSLESRGNSSKNLNIQVFSVGEDIRKARKEIAKLHQSLIRNSERNEVVRGQVEKKIATQTEILKHLQAKECKLNQEIKSQTNHRKLAIF